MAVARVALFGAALAAAGCGLGPGAGVGEVSLTVTRDFGAERVLAPVREEAAESDTAMRVLERNAEISTRYGGGYVRSIDGVAEATRGGRRYDWFFYVDGVESPVGAADLTLHGGERDLVGLPRLVATHSRCRPWSAPGRRRSPAATRASATRWRSSAAARARPAARSRSRLARAGVEVGRGLARRTRSASSSAPGRACAPTRPPRS